jgi:hypothetical protein
MYFSAVLFCTSFILMTGCQTNENLQDELKKVENVFHSYFEGICNFDYNSMRSVCTSDFFLFEDGTIWTIDDHINYLKNMENSGGAITYSFKDIKGNIDGSIAWMTHINSAEASMGGNSFHFEWLESAGFVRVDGEWRINFIDSTTVNPQE